MIFFTQKENEYNCGAIAVLNLFKIYKVQHKYSRNTLTKEVKTNKNIGGAYVFELQQVLDKKRVFKNRIYNPSFSDIKKKFLGAAIILFQIRGEGRHFSCIYKITKSYIYLTNIYCPEKEKYVEIKRFKINDFFKSARIYCVLI